MSGTTRKIRQSAGSLMVTLALALLEGGDE